MGTHRCLMMPWKASPSRRTYSRMPTSVSIGGRSVSALPSAGFWRPKINVDGGRSEVELDLGSAPGAAATAAVGTSVLTFLAAAEGEGERERLALVVPLAGADPTSISWATRIRRAGGRRVGGDGGREG